MQEEVLRRCLALASGHEDRIRHILTVSNWFAELVRDAGDDELSDVFRSLETARLPDGSSFWTPDIDVQSESECLASLRFCKRRGLRHVLWWELGLGSDVLASAASLSLLADTLISAALEMATDLLKPRFGRLPEMRFSVIGLGKLGGEELNLGSDVDLLFLWENEDQRSDGKRSVDAATYYQHLSRMLIRLLDEMTMDGRVWPVDMRLRPGGDGAPICLSMDATLSHYQGYGQTWERAMLIKARPVAGDKGLGQAFVDGIQPFVYRRYLDYTTVQALAEMKRRIDIEAGQLGIEPGFDVKRGHGGIREIEFFVQSLQMLYGGRNPDLRACPTMLAMQQLEHAGIINADDVTSLGDAYAFWRRIEHALQARRGEQTHRLPDDFADYLGQALNTADIEKQLCAHSGRVHAYFVDQFQEITVTGDQPSWLDGDEASWRQRLPIDAESFSRICAALHRLQCMRQGGLLPERCNKELNRIVDAAMQTWQGDANQAHALEYLAELMHQIGGRATWIDLLDRHELARKWLFDALAASRYVAAHVVKEPSWLEWPLENERGQQRMEAIYHQLRGLAPDVLQAEEMLAQLGQLVDQARLTCAMAVVANEADPLAIGLWMSATADLAVKAALELSLSQFDLPADFPFICLALGKHGSHEMGLVSDLDLVFVLAHDDPFEAGPKNRNWREWAQRIGRRMIQHLTTQPPFGAGYQLDARLRPSGQAGVLVTTLEAFRDYQQHDAQTWEHQALCRARAVAGPATAREAVEQVVADVLKQPRDAHVLAEEVRAMRDKMFEHLASHNSAIINLKQDAGGLVDIEFLAQYARLCFGTGENGTVTGLRKIPGQAPKPWREAAAKLADMYLGYRQMENALRVQLWQSIGSLPASDATPEWETLRRHTPVKSVAALQERMQWTRETFVCLLGKEHGE